MGEIQHGATPSSKDELHVLVTGFGPWASHTVNPSYLIARALHERLDLQDGPTIRIHTVAEPVRVSYNIIRQQIPGLLFPQVTHNPPPIFDLVLFIGLAAGSYYYKLETLARRDGYKEKDGEDGHLEPSERDLWKQLYNAPNILRPGFDTEDVWRRWKNQVLDEDVRPSSDAGLFACEFIYYTGLVEYWRRGHERPPVAFMHVPGSHDAPAIERGRRVAEALIKAMAASGRAQGVFGRQNK